MEIRLDQMLLLDSHPVHTTSVIGLYYNLSTNVDGGGCLYIDGGKVGSAELIWSCFIDILLNTSRWTISVYRHHPLHIKHTIFALYGKNKISTRFNFLSKATLKVYDQSLDYNIKGVKPITHPHGNHDHHKSTTLYANIFVFIISTISCKPKLDFDIRKRYIHSSNIYKFSFNDFRQDLEKTSAIRYARGRKLADRAPDPDRGKLNSELRQHIIDNNRFYYDFINLKLTDSHLENIFRISCSSRDSNRIYLLTPKIYYKIIELLRIQSTFLVNMILFFQYIFH
ncbi:hypothetical protein AGLY_008411 [Aphis glycines]|uniref:Uncharacterized protein n=1 Tax=Aphis glycines TaxID=307491 RepID=A0A6G0TK38_APHGL|nr:hypothetical protein AGLY_008411 [Aphis glycines]